MAEFNYRWSSEWIDQPSAARAIDQMRAQMAELERKIDALGSRSVQNTYYQQQPSTISDYYHPGWQNHQDYPWSDNYAEPSYTPDYAYPYPQPPVQKTNLEEILERYLEPYETRTNNQETYEPSLSYSPPQFQEPISNLETLLMEAIERMEKASEQMRMGTEQMEMKINNQEMFVPSPLFQLEPTDQPQVYEFSYQQPPYPQEENSNAEELLARFIENTERMSASNETTVLNLENQMQQPASADYCLDCALPSIAEMDPKEQCMAEILSDDEEAFGVVDQGLEFHEEHDSVALNECILNTVPNDIELSLINEGEEFGSAVILQKDEESNVAVGGISERLHPDWTDDSDDDAMFFEVYPQDDDSVPKALEEITTRNAHEEYYEVYVIMDDVIDVANKSDEGSYFLPINEDEFGGGPKCHVAAEEIKEKTSRRHAMTIFAYEPD